MAANSRFSVAIHMMTSMAFHPEGPVTSQYLAQSVKTNPVVIRRLLSQLRKAGLIRSQSGKAGGCRLARHPSDVALFDIFKAVELGGPFAIPAKEENKACMVACQMKRVLSEVFGQAEDALSRTLARVTLADIVRRVQEGAKAA